jgi:hypothetical protein
MLLKWGPKYYQVAISEQKQGIGKRETKTKVPGIGRLGLKDSMPGIWDNTDSSISCSPGIPYFLLSDRKDQIDQQNFRIYAKSPRNTRPQIFKGLIAVFKDHLRNACVLPCRYRL